MTFKNSVCNNVIGFYRTSNCEICIHIIFTGYLTNVKRFYNRLNWTHLTDVKPINSKVVVLQILKKMEFSQWWRRNS